MYRIVNARVLTPFEETRDFVTVDKNRFAEVSSRREEGIPAVDAGGLYLAPGFVDIHVHGGGGFSPMSARKEAVLGMCRAHALAGTTTVLPTTLAAPGQQLMAVLGAVRDAMKENTPFRIAGVHMEGPGLNPRQAGAQAPGALVPPAEVDLEAFLSVNPAIRMMGAAPEMPGGMALGDKLRKKGIPASVAHSDATYDEMQEALQHGYSDITHLYSACSGIIRKGGFRIPGVIEAGLNLDDYTVQVIADGKHLPYPLLQLIWRCRGPENIILITDGLEFAASEMSEGTVYTQYNGVRAIYEDGVMKLPDRTAFAGSVATSAVLVRNMKQAGIPLKDAVRMATVNPAERIGEKEIGRIADGYRADFVLFDEDIRVKAVVAAGQVLRDDLKLFQKVLRKA